ncbi:hypothetical protein PRNP1_005422 [Phytophthora ramorum]
MPDSISEFHGVRGIKVYNSTIVDWGSSAALTNANHPQIVSLYIVRASMASGLLPAGFQSFDFPQNLYDIEFCVTNLRALPDDLDSKWHFNADIQIEYSQLTMVPPVLLRLEPKYLALTGNAIAEVPPEIFEIPSLVSLGLGDTKLHELPRNVTNLSPAFEIVFIGGTNISFFWPWADASLERVTVWVATASPYCVDLQKILNGTASSFSVSSPEYESILMDPTESNLQTIQKSVFCEGFEGPYYYISLDDDYMALTTPPPLQKS